MKNSKPKRSRAVSFRYLFYDFVRFTAAIPGIIWFRPKVMYETRETKKQLKNGGALLISNHVGLFDPMFLMLGIWYRRHHYICMKEFFENRFRALIFKGFLCIPIDRQNFNISSFKSVTSHLKASELVCMFPEGHIEIGEQTESFKSGMILMAASGGVPIVPVYLKRREHFYNRVNIVVGAPVGISSESVTRLSMQNINELTASLYEKEKMLEKIAEQTNKQYFGEQL